MKKKETKKILDATGGQYTPLPLLVASLTTFATMAVFGYIKLQYGLGLADEGMYLVDGWRLSVGDTLFPDARLNVVFLYTQFNKFLFQVIPDLGLLGARKVQYILCLGTMTALGLAASRWVKARWIIPLSLAPFAFTGFDANGMSAGLSYYSYPQLFICLHLAALLAALKTEHGRHLRIALLLSAGVFLWAIGFSTLPLSLVAIHLLPLHFLLRKFASPTRQLPWKDIRLILIPVVLFWGITIGIYNYSFFSALGDRIFYSTEGLHVPSKGWLSLQYVVIVALPLAIMLRTIRIDNWKIGLGVQVLVSVFLAAAIATDFFGLLDPFWRGWFSRQMYFCSLLIVFAAIIVPLLALEQRTNTFWDDESTLVLILISPAVIMAVVFGLTSSLGALTLAHVAIPLTLALAVFLVWSARRCGYSSIRQTMFVTLLLLPFFYHLVWADWHFTNFDLTPSKLKYQVKDGFARGIRTNREFGRLEAWVREKAQLYSKPDDFALVMDQAPMVYMLIKRRPALNHSWTGLAMGAPSLRRESLRQALSTGRHPKIAFRFMTYAMLLPISLENETFKSIEVSFASNDPLSLYLERQMKIVDRLFIDGSLWVECWVDREEVVPSVSNPIPNPQTFNGID